MARARAGSLRRRAAGRAVLAIANWKMNKTLAEAEAYVRALRPRISNLAAVEIVLAPAFVHLAAVARRARGSRLGIAGQNCHSETRGAFTGEVSAAMLKDAGASAVLVGHSERRRDQGEKEPLLQAKLRAALDAGLRPVLCVGESLGERRRGRTHAVLRRQIEGALDGVGLAPGRGLVIAYEPVWAIGTGENASPAEAQGAAAFVRGSLGDVLGPAVAETTPILYGGSVTPDNAGSILDGADVDGALVGGASLDPASFAAIARSLGSIAARRS